MSNKLYNETSVQNIANAIRNKKGYTGKNLIPFKNQDFTLNNVRHYVENGKLYLNGTTITETTQSNAMYKNNFNFVLPAGTYYFNRGSDTTLPIYIVDYNTNVNLIVNQGELTLSEPKRVYLGIFLYQRNLSNQLIDCQLEQGSTATSYEQYCRYTINEMANVINNIKSAVEQEKTGYPLNLDNCLYGRLLNYKLYGNSTQNGTPTPETPIEIKSIGDLVESGEYIGKYKIPVVSSGKNLANLNVIPNTTIITNNGDGTLTLANNPNTSGFTTTTKKLKELCPSLKVGDVAKFSFINTTTGTENNYIYVGEAWSTGTTKTITQALLDANVAIYGGYNETSTISNFMIRKVNYGDDTYEPYHKPIITNIYLDKPLRKIGNVKDEIDFENGKRIDKISEYIFNGSEYWVDYASQVGDYYKAYCSSVRLGTSNNFEDSTWSMCDHFKTGNIYENVSIGFTKNATYLSIPSNIVNSASTLKQWFTNNNTKVLYPLATPTEEAIDLPTIPTFEGTTIITCDSETKPTDSYGKYYKLL